MLKKIIYICALLLLLATAFVAFYTFLNSPKIVFIDSNKLIESYAGFKEAQDLHEQNISRLSESFNKQNELYSIKLKKLTEGEKTLSRKQKEEGYNELKRMQEVLIKLKKHLETKSREEEEKLMKGIINKINDFVERYSEKNGIDAVVSAQGDGGVIYRSETLDYTEQIIYEMNIEYEGNL